MIATTGKQCEWNNNMWECVLRYRDKEKAQNIGESALLLVTRTKPGDNSNEAHDVLKEKDYNIKRVRRLLQCNDPAFVTLSCLCAGIDDLEYSATPPSETQMVNMFPAIGFKKLKDKQYLTSERLLKKGDILVKAGACAVYI